MNVKLLDDRIKQKGYQRHIYTRTTDSRFLYTELREDLDPRGRWIGSHIVNALVRLPAERSAGWLSEFF